ncbi:hypothetical protein RRV45_15080 [Bacillus sp. DTU_2020_1000418_1_SI_GHA_SEK_038]|uniref:hypothetical protein n=1 Tax=Bacillus sp. DTU_2020_1000418_1_SI_GHA_SEK_038 TaxID=3077585 RepID=UPI0028E18719|nr:hypothetical protein [Bacillus sp. DTU_2020_1000418_1_SI_GHA_SEK_038]WNS74232.1 hypothetical protein RRV45_15080 [Bacillus sp. DTU_2020_1000418_1_SI_GHA_SEK_038]
MTVIYGFRTSTYARNIYMFGVTKFETIDPAYIEPVKQFAAANYTDDQIKHAYTQGWINEEQFNDTMAYKYPTVSE